MRRQRFDSVWEAIADTSPEAANLKLRSTLMIILENHIRANQLTQAQAAEKFGVTQPRMSDLLRGKINLFSLDTLVNMAAAAQIELTLHAQPHELADAE
jgi:predicted XRE-type DNA-binding protein